MGKKRKTMDAHFEEEEVWDEAIEELAELEGYHNIEIGQRGESAAARYLELCDIEVLERNWKCPMGEADIVAWDDDENTLVFVEVKTRTSINRGFPAEAVDERKRARYEKIAAWYLLDHDFLDVRIRFDVVDLLVIGRDRAMIKHYVNAFGCA